MILQLVCKWSETCLASLPTQLIPILPSSPHSAHPWSRRSPWAHPTGEKPRAALSSVVWGRSETGTGREDWAMTDTWHETMASARSTGLWSPVTATISVLNCWCLGPSVSPCSVLRLWSFFLCKRNKSVLIFPVSFFCKHTSHTTSLLVHQNTWRNKAETHSPCQLKH